jgi:hypothetical protein
VARSDRGRIPIRVIVIQLVIIAGLIAFLKIYLPHREKANAAARLDERESRIEKFFKSMVVEDSRAGTSGANAQSLRNTPSMQDVEQALGAPDTSSTDFAGGLHLTWIGARHSLEAGFDRGRLYFLTLTNRSTGHGVTVFESSASRRTF